MFRSGTVNVSRWFGCVGLWCGYRGRLFSILPHQYFVVDVYGILIPFSQGLRLCVPCWRGRLLSRSNMKGGAEQHWTHSYILELARLNMLNLQAALVISIWTPPETKTNISPSWRYQAIVCHDHGMMTWPVAMPYCSLSEKAILSRSWAINC